MSLRFVTMHFQRGNFDFGLKNEAPHEPSIWAMLRNKNKQQQKIFKKWTYTTYT